VAMDASGRGLDGKLINGPSFVKGKVANSLRLNGTNQYVDLGKRLELPGAYTIALWVKLQANANQTILSDHSATSSLCHYAIEVVPSGQVRYVWLHGDRMNQFTTQDSLTLGTWAHLAATKDESGTVKLHLNGKVIPAVIRDPKHVVQISLPNEFGSLSIGRAGDFDKSYMNGFVDDVRVYTRALQPEEIAILIKLAEH